MAATGARADEHTGYVWYVLGGMLFGYFIHVVSTRLFEPHVALATVGYIGYGFDSAVFGGSVALEYLHCRKWRFDRSWSRFFVYASELQFVWIFVAILASAFVSYFAAEALRALGYTVPSNLKAAASATNQWAGWIGVAGAALVWRCRIWLSNRRLKYGVHPGAEFHEASQAVVQTLDGLGTLLFGSIALLIGIGLFGAAHAVLALATSILDLFPDWFRYGGYIGILVLAILALNYGLRRIVAGIGLLFGRARSDVEEQMAHGAARLATEAEAFSAAKGAAESPIHSLKF